jgi:Ni,Fe-hydrogenase III small subunit/ferredoxin
MAWVLRGLRNGVVTTGYPKREDSYFDGWRGVAELREGEQALDRASAAAVVDLCPAGAIGFAHGSLTLDQGRCIGCARCVDAFPGWFAWHSGSDVARLTRASLIEPPVEESSDALAEVRAALSARTRLLGRSVHLRHVDAGSDGSEEWEIAALLNPVYDIHRLGLFFTASPRHADVLLVTGIGSTGMVAPLQRTLEAMPRPVVVVAVGADACSGGVHASSYAGSAGVGDLLDVDVWVPGSPPSPFAILHGLLLALDRLPSNDLGGRS